MSLYSVLLLIGVLLFPFSYAEAIPPPELITGTVQSLLSIVGLVAASVVLVVAGIKNSFTAWYPRYRTHFIIVLGLCLLAALLLLIYAAFNQQQARTEQIQDLQAIWEKFDPIYDAQTELTTNADLRTVPGTLSWKEYSSRAGAEPIIIDLRAPAAFELGHVVGSQNIRFTDLLRGDWKQLTAYQNQPIYLICYQGTTGALTTLFLQERGFTQVYRPDGGLLSAVNELPLSQLLTLPIRKTRYLYTTIDSYAELPQHSADSYVIDLRLPKADKPTISSDDTLVYPHLTISEINAQLASWPRDEEFTLVCDSEVSCYNADVLTLDMQKQALSVKQIIEYEPAE